MRRAAPVEERFWSKVEKTESCWNWTGSMLKGYGRMNINGSLVRAHRYSYVMAGAQIPDGMQIDHICRNRACVNPKHLRPVTHKENAENLANRAKSTRSGVRGVTPTPRGKWQARVMHNRKFVSAGTHPTIEEAEAAVIAKRLELFTHNDLDRAA